MEKLNCFELKLLAKAENEAFARHIVGDFVLELNPTLEELEDIKTAVSEAVTNAIVHGYNNEANNEILLKCSIYQDKVVIIVSDSGVGIKDIDKALEPFYTTKPSEERSGMGFTLMSSFMSELDVKSIVGEGTTLTMTKFLPKEEDNARAE